MLGGLWFLKIFPDFRIFFKSPFASTFSWKKRSCHQGKKEVACIVSKPLVACFWGVCASKMKHSAGSELQQALDQRETQACYPFVNPHPWKYQVWLHDATTNLLCYHFPLNNYSNCLFFSLKVTASQTLITSSALHLFCFQIRFWTIFLILHLYFISCFISTDGQPSNLQHLHLGSLTISGLSPILQGSSTWASLRSLDLRRSKVTMSEVSDPGILCLRPTGLVDLCPGGIEVIWIWCIGETIGNYWLQVGGIGPTEGSI